MKIRKSIYKEKSVDNFLKRKETHMRSRADDSPSGLAAFARVREVPSVIKERRKNEHMIKQITSTQTQKMIARTANFFLGVLHGRCRSKYRVIKRTASSLLLTVNTPEIERFPQPANT